MNLDDTSRRVHVFDVVRMLVSWLTGGHYLLKRTISVFFVWGTIFTNKSCPGTVFLLTTVPWANEYEAVKLGSQYDAGTSVALVSVQPIRLSKGLIAVLRHVSFFKPGSQNNAGAVRVTKCHGRKYFSTSQIPNFCGDDLPTFILPDSVGYLCSMISLATTKHTTILSHGQLHPMNCFWLCETTPNRALPSHSG